VLLHGNTEILSTSAMLVLRQGKEFFKEITKLYKLHYI